MTPEIKLDTAQQLANVQILAELKNISDGLRLFGDVGSSTFIEYRKTLHERFGRVHEQIGAIEFDIEKLASKVTNTENILHRWQANWKMLVVVLYLAATFSGAVLVTYGPGILRTFSH